MATLLSPPLDLPALRLALRVADLGSVAAAARELDQLAATASAAIRRLEEQLGVALFARNSRALRATPEGAVFLQRAREALALLEDGVNELRAPMTQVRGLLRLGVSVDLGTQTLLPLLDEFLQLHPRLQLDLQVSDRVADLGREPVDAAVRYGMPAQAGQIVRHLADNVRVLVASPAYLARCGMPASPEALAQHEGIALRLSGRSGSVWKMFWHGKPVEIAPRVRRSTDNGLVARRWALAGLGIAAKAELDVRGDLADGRLVHVLPGLHSAPYPLVLALANGTHLSARVRALGQFLQARLHAGVTASVAPPPRQPGSE